MTFPGWKTLRQSGRWLRSRLTGGALILGYHRVAEPPRDPFGMCVSPAHFAQHLEMVRRVASPISLAELVERAQAGEHLRRSVVITFDDGYRDNLLTARPLLEACGIPATIFVTTGLLGGLFWWDELESLVYGAEALPETGTLDAGGSSFQWAYERTPDSRARLLLALYHWLLPLDEDARGEALAQVRAWAAMKGSRLLMTPEEIRTLAQSELIEIGAHTVTHPVLTHLPADAQRREISESKAYLGTLLGRTIRGFSYPNGAQTALTRSIVNEVGFAYACTSAPDVTSAASDRWALPRFWIPDWDGETFYRWLMRWLC